MVLIDSILSNTDLLEDYNRIVDQSSEDHPTILSNLSSSVEYRDIGEIEDSILHIGQRKLFLNELQFLNSELKRHNDEAIIIYAGSAPSMHLPYLGELFPSLRFILVDPNEHCLIMKDAPRPDSNDDLNVTHYTHGRDVAYVSSRPDSRSRYRLMNGYSPQRRIQVWNGNKLVRNTTPQEHTFPTKQQEIGTRILSCIKKRKDIRYIISESYFTDELCSILSKLDKPLFFWSDIRTSESSRPGDADVILNNLQQTKWVHILRPTTSMLKFRPPYYPRRDSDIEAMNRYYHTLKRLEKLASGKLLQWAKKTYGIDAVKDHKNKTLRILSGDLYIQPWAGPISGELRLRVRDISLQEIDLFSYEDLMFRYNRLIRPYRFHTGYEKNYGIDSCGDCSLEMKIWNDYDPNNTDYPYRLGRRVGPTYRTLHTMNHGKFHKPYEKISSNEAKIILEQEPSYSTDISIDQNLINSITQKDKNSVIRDIGPHSLGVAVEGSPIVMLVLTNRIEDILSLWNEEAIDIGQYLLVKMNIGDVPYEIRLTEDRDLLRREESTIARLYPLMKDIHMKNGVMAIQKWAVDNLLINPYLGYLDGVLLTDMIAGSISSPRSRMDVILKFVSDFSPISYIKFSNWHPDNNVNRYSWQVISYYINKGIDYRHAVEKKRYELTYVTNAMTDEGLLDAFHGIYIHRIRLYSSGKITRILITGESPIVMDMGIKRWISGRRIWAKRINK